MEELLLQLGFTAKETKVYLALLEFGNQPASLIAKKTEYPKSTVLFLFDGLLKRGYIRRSKKGRIQYFYADPKDLEIAKSKELAKETETLSKILPLLSEMKHPFSSEPKVTFFEGIDACRKAYSLLLESKTEVLEFGAHDDLVKKFGREFMDGFIAGRVKNKVYIKAVAQRDEIHKELCKFNKKQLREIKFFPKENGRIYSSICMFEDKVLMLNLHHDAFAILIESKQVSDTMKLIHKLVWK